MLASKMATPTRKFDNLRKHSESVKLKVVSQRESVKLKVTNRGTSDFEPPAPGGGDP